MSVRSLLVVAVACLLGVACQVKQNSAGLPAPATGVDDAALAEGPPVAVAPDATGALVAVSTLPVVPVGVAAPPQDAAMSNASARTAALLFFTTWPP